MQVNSKTRRNSYGLEPLLHSERWWAQKYLSTTPINMQRTELIVGMQRSLLLVSHVWGFLPGVKTHTWGMIAVTKPSHNKPSVLPSTPWETDTQLEAHKESRFIYSVCYFILFFYRTKHFCYKKCKSLTAYIIMESACFKIKHVTLYKK